MKLLRFGPRGRERPGLLDHSAVVRDLSGVIPDIEAAAMPDILRTLRALPMESLPIATDVERFGPPLRGVGKIICIGLNYASHAKETGQAAPREPILFLKATSSIIGPDDDIVLPPGAAKADWEVELGVVIGAEARYVTREAALQHVAGFCVINDVSERSYQLERGGQWDKGKGCDTFCPLGPWLVTIDELATPAALRLQCKVNGRTVQDGNTSDMIFDVPFLVHYVSQFMSLQPGDIISTGTPHGVGMSMQPPQWLQEGDIVELAIDALGTQRQRVTRYAAAGPSR